MCETLCLLIIASLTLAFIFHLVLTYKFIKYEVSVFHFISYDQGLRQIDKQNKNIPTSNENKSFIDNWRLVWIVLDYPI